MPYLANGNFPEKKDVIGSGQCVALSLPHAQLCTPPKGA